MRALLIDDERLAREELKKMLHAYPNIEIVGEASNVDEAIQLIDKFDPDVLFLDIQMPEKTGFELLDELSQVPHVIFVTAYDEHAIKAFEVNALDYLLKPIESDRLSSAIAKVEKKVDEIADKDTYLSTSQGKLHENSRIFIKDGEKCWFVELSRIRMFESEGNYVKVHFDKFRPLILRSLNSLEERLDEYMFFRANRKFIINLKHIESIESWFNGGLKVILKEGDTVEISRRQAVRFKELMSI